MDKIAISPALMYERPECIELSNGIIVKLTDEDVSEVWSWRECEELALEVYYQLCHGSEEDVRFVMKRLKAHPEDAGSLFETCWELYYDEGAAYSISRVAVEGIKVWKKGNLDG